ncbi:MAG: hypothetical protein ACOYJD_08330 [Christensenellales bacterium]|jgi:hypothetical protein
MRDVERVIRGWSLDGASEEEIAKGLGISVVTLKKKYGRAMKSAFLARGMMLDALYALACGYETEEEQIVKPTKQDGGEARVEKVKKHVPPAPTILKFLAEARLGFSENTDVQRRPLKVYFGGKDDG